MTGPGPAVADGEEAGPMADERERGGRLRRLFGRKSRPHDEAPALAAPAAPSRSVTEPPAPRPAQTPPAGGAPPPPPRPPPPRAGRAPRAGGAPARLAAPRPDRDCRAAHHPLERCREGNSRGQVQDG